MAVPSTGAPYGAAHVMSRASSWAIIATVIASSAHRERIRLALWRVGFWLGGTFSGLRAVEPAYRDVARVMGAGERQIFLKVALPAGILVLGLRYVLRWRPRGRMGEARELQ